MLGTALARRRDLEIDLKEMDAVIESLQSRLHNARRNSDTPHLPAVMPREFKGMTLREALKAYLQRRPGLKITYERAAEDLWAGGAVWDDRKGKGPEGRLHNFKMSCTVNYDLVEQDKKAGVLWLAAAREKRLSRNRSEGKRRQVIRHS
jgi:hypothetical protein